MTVIVYNLFTFFTSGFNLIWDVMFINHSELSEILNVSLVSFQRKI